MRIFPSLFADSPLQLPDYIICCIYNPYNGFIKHHLKELGKAIESYSKTYENITIMDDFEAGNSEPNLACFLTIFNFKSLANNKPTCYKNPYNHSCIDLKKLSELFSKFINFWDWIIEFPYNDPDSFQIAYRNCKRFDSQTFENVFSKKIEENMSKYFEAFKHTIIDTLEKYVPLKKQYQTVNHCIFVTEQLRNAIISRSRLRNQFLKNRSAEFRI